jgi:hypothetical protein
MAKRKAGNKKAKQAGNGENGGIVSLTKELFQAAITLRGWRRRSESRPVRRSESDPV